MLRVVLITLLMMTGALIIWAPATISLNSIYKDIETLFAPSSEPKLKSAKPSIITRSEPTLKKAEPPVTTASEPILKIETGFHAAIVNKISLTRKGQLISVSDDKTARLWTSITEPSKALRVPIGQQNEGALYAVAASPTKDIAVVGGSTGISWDNAGTVYSIDLNTGEIIGSVIFQNLFQLLAPSKTAAS